MQRDEFFWTSTINKATIVVNAAEGLLSNEAAREAAGGVARLEAKAEKDPALRVKSYIAYEPLLIAETSPAVTLIHAGRVRTFSPPSGRPFSATAPCRLPKPLTQ